MIRKVLLFSFIGFIFLNFTDDKTDNNKRSILIDKWLKTGIYELRPPVFSEVKNTENKKFTIQELLTFENIDIKHLNPSKGMAFEWGKIISDKWEDEMTDKSGFAHPSRNNDDSKDLVAYYATYIFTDRWAEAEIKIYTPQLCVVCLDGKEIAKKTDCDTDKNDIKTLSEKAQLERGNHLLVIKTLKNKDCEADWKLKGEIIIEKDYSETDITVNLKNKYLMTINNLLDGVKINNVIISDDGKYYALRYSETRAPDGKKNNWYEVRMSDDNSLVNTFKNASISNLSFSPNNQVSYITKDKKKSSLCIFDPETGEDFTILESIENLSGYRWSPDGEFIIYSVREKPEEDKSGINKLEGMPDRWPWWRSRDFLYKVDIRSKLKERLTYGYLSTSLQDVSRDGRYILFSQSFPDYLHLPYSKNLLFSLDLNTNIVDTLWEHNWASQASFSPDNKSLLVIGGPALFGKVGENISTGKTSNNYDRQAYIYNIYNKSIEPITLNFNPSIQNAYWDGSGKYIYFLAAHKSYQKLFMYDISAKTFREITGTPDVINRVDFSKNKDLAVLTGSSISTPDKAYLLYLSNDSIETIADPESDKYKDVIFGKTEEWTFTNDNGHSIDGHIYYPPDFESGKQYPLIVYYYGGTSPTKRSFGGRYPKNLFAAQGYVVYVLQPSGAYGYGQEFSAMHVNNWGITVADEIIKGTKQFIKEHPFIDKARVGCIGASYGGFMTMLLQTRTDIFSAAVAHAGISSISSYWGEGYWGYLYSAVASANSFPWNNKKLYVEQSPLFNADKINTPLLLLHGASDTNVPPGESRQLYTALKLLGKEVELIEIEGQDHHILDYKKRIYWQKTIFAWFDRWLKDQPEWWENLYPKKNF